MAKINFLTAYPTATPVASSIVIGSIASGGATNNFLMSDIAAYVMTANTLTLQDVCDNGTATTTGITIGGAVDINSTADISDTLTLSKPTGTGLSVTADASVGGTLGVTGVSTLGEIDASGVADIADTLTLSKATGTGLDVTASISVGSQLTAGTSTVSQTTVSADGFQTNNSSFTASSSAVSCSFGTTFTTFDATITTCKITGSAPASAGAAGTTGTIVTDADYIYVCTATNTWKRVAIATW